jgi:DNA-binding beta-propeller fold protein YncE
MDEETNHCNRRRGSHRCCGALCGLPDVHLQAAELRPPSLTKIFLTTGSHPENVAINAAGTYAYVTEKSTSKIAIIDLKTLTVKSELSINPNTGPYSVVITPDGNSLLVGGQNLTIVNLATLATTLVPIPFPKFSYYGISGISVTSDSQWGILSCRGDGEDAVVNLNTHSVSTPFTVDQGPKGSAMGLHNVYMYQVSQGASTLQKIDWRNGTVAANLVTGPVWSSPWPAYPAGDTSWITLGGSQSTAYLTGIRSGNVTQVSLSTFSITHVVNVGAGTAGGPFGIQISPGGGTLFVADYGSGKMTQITISGWGQASYSTGGSGPLGLAVSPDGSKVVVAVGDSDLVAVFTYAAASIPS